MISFDIRQIETTESTNDDAKRAAETGAPEGTVIWALSQTAGRGRRGRAWSSPAGNLYCSIVLRPQIDLKDYGFYSFLSALAISDVVRSILPDSVVELKWPNDVLIGGKKVSGILLETGGEGDKNWLVIGIGLNIQHYPDNPLYPVTSLAAEGASMPALRDIVGKLLTKLDDWNGVLHNLGFAPVRDAWLGRARKGTLRIKLPAGEIVGEFADLDGQGSLHVNLPDGSERCVMSGDILSG